MNTRLLLIVFATAGWIRVCQAQVPADVPTSELLDVIPVNSRVGLSWPEVTRLGPKVNQLVQKVYPGAGQMTLSWARSFFVESGIDYRDPDFLTIVDRHKPGATFALNALKDGQINVMPVGDLEKMAAMLGVDRERLEQGDVLPTKHGIHVRYANGYVYSSRSQDILGSARVETPVGKRMTDAQRNRFASFDAVLQLDAEFVTECVGQIRDWFGDLSWLSGPENEKQMDEFTKLLYASAREFEFGLAGIELDGGLGIQYTSFFKQARDSQVQKLIESIRGGDGASNLDHLPNDQFILALAACGTGEKNVFTARAFLKAIVDRVSPGEEILSAQDKSRFYDSFARIWQQLNGTRAAAYRIESSNVDDGCLAAIAIFDVADPKRLLAQLPDLVAFANESAQRNSQKQNLLPIRFRYQPGASTISGYPVDVLEIDTDRLDAETKRRFRILFGEQARRFRLVPVKDHLVLLVGSDTRLLVKTIDNLDQGDPGLKLHPAMVAANRQLDARHKIEAHFSFRNLIEVYDFKEKPKPFQASEEVSSMAITVESDRVGLDLWFPAGEIDAAVDWSVRW